MPNLTIVPIEPLGNRYTGHWYTYLPDQLRESLVNYKVNQLYLDYSPKPTAKGEFLNFADTITFKSLQMAKIAEMFSNKEVHTGDAFLFTDAWNLNILQLRYLSVLNQVPVKIISIWHAGSYDEHDILFQRANQVKAVEEFRDYEEDLYLASDLNVFATEFHRNMFMNQLGLESSRSIVCGFPMEYYKGSVDINFTPSVKKEKIVLFPHRKGPEKAPEEFERLEQFLPDYQFIYTQDVCSNKMEYHRLLEKAEVVFSAAKQETLGICMYEALLAGCKIMVPDRLSYTEMYSSDFKYDRLEDIPGKLEKISQGTVMEESILVGDRFFNGNRLYKAIDRL